MTIPVLWDAHAHIQKPWYTDKETEELIIDARNKLIEGIINVISSPTVKDYSNGIKLALKYPEVFTNFGLQPTEASNESFQIFLNAVASNHNSICAIGEVGLDYYWVTDTAQQNLQKEIFTKCIATANEYKLPLVIHSRKAEDDCLNMLESQAAVPVLMHGMEASDEHIKRIIDLNYYITIPTSVCIRKKYKKIAIKTPLEQILLETDSPFQLPFNPPVGEKVKNRPSNVLLSAHKIAEVKEISFEDVANLTTKNTRLLFQI